MNLQSGYALFTIHRVAVNLMRIKYLTFPVPYDRTSAQLLFDYLSEIHEQKPIILNINLEFSNWCNVLYDEQMTTALVGRLMHHCHLLLFPGENNRLRESSINDLYRSIASTDKKED